MGVDAGLGQGVVRRLIDVVSFLEQLQLPEPVALAEGYEVSLVSGYGADLYEAAGDFPVDIFFAPEIFFP